MAPRYRLSLFVSALVLAAMACTQASQSDIRGYTPTPTMPPETSTPTTTPTPVVTATPTALPMDLPDAVVMADTLEIRIGPGMDFVNVGNYLVRGTTVKVIGCRMVMDDTWANIYVPDQGVYGWVGAVWHGSNNIWPPPEGCR